MLISTLQQSFLSQFMPVPLWSLPLPWRISRWRTGSFWHLDTRNHPGGFAQFHWLNTACPKADGTRAQVSVESAACSATVTDLLWTQSAVDANTAQNRVWPQKASGRMQETNFCLLLSLCIHILHVKLPHTCGKLVKFVMCQTAMTVLQRELKTSVKS